MIYLFGLIGVVAAAASGALAAGRKRFDMIGVCVVSVVTALGGGTIRDLLLDRRVFWIADAAYLWTALAATAVTVIYVRFRHPPRRSLLIVDGLALALFSIVGAQYAEEFGHSGIVVVVMAAVTGAGGGVLRDVLSNEVPLLFRNDEPLYATASIAGTTLYLALQSAGLGVDLAALAGMTLIAALRFAAILWRWRLPVFTVPGEKEG